MGSPGYVTEFPSYYYPELELKLAKRHYSQQYATLIPAEDYGVALRDATFRGDI